MAWALSPPGYQWDVWGGVNMWTSGSVWGLHTAPSAVTPARHSLPDQGRALIYFCIQLLICYVGMLMNASF